MQRSPGIAALPVAGLTLHAIELAVLLQVELPGLYVIAKVLVESKSIPAVRAPPRPAVTMRTGVTVGTMITGPATSVGPTNGPARTKGLFVLS